jgi:hypothetical protein
MQVLVDNILENKSLTFAAEAIAALLAAALVLVIFRLAPARRLKAPSNGRARLPRLGVIDAVDVDRQRQLVIVRRDNIEHLLMIGGPNDVVIESGIIRAEAREQRLREKELREREPQTAAAVHAPGPSPAAPPQPQVEPAHARIETSPPPRKGGALPIQPALSPGPQAVTPASDGNGTATAPHAAAVSPPAAPAQRTPTFPLPPRRTAQMLTPRPPREPLIRPDPAVRGDGASGVFPRAPLSTPFLRSSPPRQLAEMMAKTAAPASASATSPSTPAAQPPEAARSEPAPKEVVDAAATEPSLAARPQPSNGPDALSGPSPLVAPLEPSVEAFAKSEGAGEKSEAAAERAAHMAAFEAEDSLEEEMAKLLGRGLSR